MKLKSPTINNYKLLKIYLLKLRVYLKTSSNKNLKIFLNKYLETKEVNLKTALKIIHEFHCNKRKIMFFGNFCEKKNYLSKIIKQMRHIHISSKNWIPGILKNNLMFLEQASTIKNIKTNQTNQPAIKKIKVSLNLVKRPGLIILIDSKIETEILKEIYKLNIPVISFNTNILELKDSSINDYQIEEFSIQVKNQLLSDLVFLSMLKTMNQKKMV